MDTRIERAEGKNEGGLKTTPFFMTIPGREAQFMKYKKQQRKKTEKFYAPKIESMLNPNNKSDITQPKEAFQKSRKSTLSTTLSGLINCQTPISECKKSPIKFRG